MYEFRSEIKIEQRERGTIHTSGFAVVVLLIAIGRAPAPHACRVVRAPAAVLLRVGDHCSGQEAAGGDAAAGGDERRRGGTRQPGPPASAAAQGAGVQLGRRPAGGAASRAQE
jgi:hypothetical protein